MQRFNLNGQGQDVTLSIDSRLYDPKNTNILGPHEVLLVGAAYCGKTTLSSKLGDIILDDDLTLVTTEHMRVAGKMGFISYEHPETGRKYLMPLPNGVKEAHIDLVFILDRKTRGGNGFGRRYHHSATIRSPR